MHAPPSTPPNHDPASSAPPPRLSVIVPNYNHARYLSARIDSILSQTFQDFELIVLDDASSDDSLAVLRSSLGDRPHQLIVNDRNSGSPCSQWLRGIEQARGDYIWIAESDDGCSPDFLASLLPPLERGATLAYCRSATIDANGTDISAHTLYWPDRLDPHLWRHSFAMPTQAFCRRWQVLANAIPNASAVVFRRRAALACLALRPLLNKLLHCGDWLFWFELLAHQEGQLCFVAEPLSQFRCHTASTRTAQGSRAQQARHLADYGRATDWIRSHPLLLGSDPFPQRVRDGQWDWMLLEYLVRSQPTALQILAGQGLQGTLRALLPQRLLRSAPIRRLAFPRAGSWLNQRLALWQTAQARLKACLKAPLPAWLRRFQA